MTGIPLISLLLRIEKHYGLKQLAYEMEYENMTEVLAGLKPVLAHLSKLVLI